MARFFDEIKADSKVESHLQHIPVIVADNVQEYVIQIGYTKSLELTTNLPVTPPFKDCFIEHMGLDESGEVKVGHFIHREETAEGWNILVTTFMRYRRDKPVLVSIIEFNLRRTGEIDDDLKLHHWLFEGVSHQDYILTGMTPMFLTLVFLNTQKVERIETTPNEKLSKRHQKKYGSPLTKFITLKVNAVNKPSAKEHQGGSHQSPAHHIVRGHFRRFTDEAPLFGKWVGVYWWGEFERGKKERGEITKEYEVVVNEDD